MEKDVRYQNIENRKKGVLSRNSILKLHFSKIFMLNLAIAMSFLLIFSMNVNAGDVIVKEGSINASSTSYFLGDLTSRNITLTQGGFKSSATTSNQNFIFEDTVGNDYVDIYCRDTSGTDLCEFRSGLYVSGSNLWVTNSIISRGNIYDDAGNTVEILDNVTISGNLTVSGNLTIPNLVSCDVKTGASGNFYCGTDASGGSSDNPWQFGSNTIYNNTANVKLGIGTNSPGVTLHSSVDGSSVSTPATGTGLAITNSGTTTNNAFMTIQSGATGYAGIQFGDNADNDQAVIEFLNGASGRFLRFSVVREKMRITDTGYVGIGDSSPSYQLELSTDSAAKPSTNTWTISSDERLKQNMNGFIHGLDALNLINPITYRYKNISNLPTEEINVGIGAGALSSSSETTFNDPTFFNSISEFEMEDENGVLTTYKGFNSHILTYLLINAVKELDKTSVKSSSNGDVAIAGNLETAGSVETSGDLVVEGNVESNGNVSVNGSVEADTYLTNGTDYAEVVTKLNPKESIHSGDIVGIFNGKASKNTLNAHGYYIVSGESAGIIGGSSENMLKSDFTTSKEIPVAFVGQIKARVKGVCNAGNWVIHSGDNDGSGKCIDIKEQTDLASALTYMEQKVGIAWESKSTEEIGLINVAVGR